MKKEIRKEVLKKRDSLSQNRRKGYDEVIVRRLSRFLHGRVLSSMAAGSEPDLSSLAPDRVFAYPKVMDGTSMKAFVSSSFETGPFSIREPSGGIEISPEELDVILVPMVAFDERLHRLGHGKGYYDRFLKDTKAFKIGIAYEIQKKEDIPIDEGDVSMDIIVTEEKIYSGTAKSSADGTISIVK